tara:strand:+ start:1335 stop:1823 length:489 start_codon:yes stop_codon:yes gene_type:complete
MSAYIEIPYLYNKAMKSKRNGDLKKASKLFLQCHNVYQNAELPMFSSEIKEKGEDSIIQYRKINTQTKINKPTSIVLGILATAFLLIKTIYLYPENIDTESVHDYANDLPIKDFAVFFVPCFILISIYTYLEIRKNYKWALIFAVISIIFIHINPFIHFLES